MTHSNNHDRETYNVVFNHEEQYSIWPTDKEPPAGWEKSGFSGSKDECLANISATWTDMRPLSLRKALDPKPSQE